MAGSEDERRRAVEFVDTGAVDGVLVAVLEPRPRRPRVAGGHRGPRRELRRPARVTDGPIGLDRRRTTARAPPAPRATSWPIGRRTLAAITGTDDLPGGDQRRAGFLDVVGADVDPRRVVASEDTPEAVGEAVTRLLTDVDGLDAIFVGNDATASWALEALHRRGRAVPGDVAVAGFGDGPVAASATPPLTTMRQDYPALATTMVDLLFELLAGRPPRAVVLPTELVVRASTAG